MENDVLLEVVCELIRKGSDKLHCEFPFVRGEQYFIRTATYHSVGRIKNIKGKFLLMEKASWIAESGRFMNALQEGKLNEVEPVGDMILNTDSIIDAFPWPHKLPTEQK